MNREVIWQANGGIGEEHLTLSDRNGVIVADGFAIAKLDAGPMRVRYQIVCGADWVTRGVAVTTEVAHGSPAAIELRSDGKGRWSNSDGSPLPQLDGCVDVDITITPFTNTLPIRRLALAPGVPETIHVVYINVEGLTVEPREQVYTRLSEDTVRYEGVPSGFRADLEVDADGLVRNYPGLWTRTWTSQGSTG